MPTLYFLIQAVLCSPLLPRPFRFSRSTPTNEFLSPQDAFIINMKCDMSDNVCMLAEKSVKSAANRIASEILFKRPIRVTVELETITPGFVYLAKTNDYGNWMGIIC